ncbi:MAG: acetylglutamate kinase [Deltaproteobacteria bacterium]|nr:MAG: acetylglutamate kinase [Deltaproteobacteria bacterium]
MSDTSQERVALLREALPFIQKFKGSVFIVKLSGKVTEDSTLLHSIMEEVALFHQVGFFIVVIHGGGKQLTHLAEQMGVEQTIINGRRVTDSETLDLAKMVFMGKINTEILSTLRRLGIPSVGLSGLAGNIIRAKRRKEQPVTDRTTGERKMVDYGHVGDIVEIDARLLKILLNEGYVPVLSSLGADDEGNVYNINADTIAAEIAVELNAEKLLLLSDVDGIYRDFEDKSSLISRMTLEEAEAMYKSKGVGAGMMPKIYAIIDLLKRGVKAAHILNGRRENVMLQEIFTLSGSGTMISSQER